MSVDPSKTAFAAPEYPIDKIVGFYEGSFSIAAAGTDTTFVPPPGEDVSVTAQASHIHDLGYIPLTDMIWSIDNINFRPGGVEIITDYGDSSFNASFDALIALEKVNSTTVTIFAESLDQTARTIYYKVWLIHPE